MTKKIHLYKEHSSMYLSEHDSVELSSTGKTGTGRSNKTQKNLLNIHKIFVRN